jgi:serine/threonine protein kinase
VLQPAAIIDNYEILNLLGSGGFGRVWRAKDLTVNGREVAIKELTNPTTEHVEGFLREMELLSTLKHPGIVTFHHALNKGQHLVMEYIPEGSLRQQLEIRQSVGIQGNHRFGIEKAVEILIGLCDVLSTVHDKGVVHRDLKPDNLFLQDRTIRVGDFGIAAVLRPGEQLQTFGTRSYMAPECFKADFGLANHRVDLYAAGVIFFELLTGANPFMAGDPQQVIYKICFDDTPIPINMPKWLQGVLRKALAKSPDLRFQSAAEMKQTLESRATPQLYPAALLKANRAFAETDRLLARGKVSRALTQSEIGLAVYPKHPRLTFTRAKCLLILRRSKEALPELLRARQLDPGIQCEKELGYAHIENEDYGKAIACLTEYTRRRPDDLTSFALLMEALYKSGAYEDAMEIGGALREEHIIFVNNGLLASTLASDLKKGKTLFEAATKHMQKIPQIIRYNMTVLSNLTPKDADRLRSWLFFAQLPNTIMPGKSLRPKVKPLRIDVETKDRQNTTHTSDTGFVSVGRQTNLDISVTTDRKMSRFHSLFYYRDGLFHYRDLQSTTGSFLGDTPIKGEIPIVGMEAIRAGDTWLKVSY